MKKEIQQILEKFKLQQAIKKYLMRLLKIMVKV